MNCRARVTRCTSARPTCKCTRTTIGRTRPSYKKDFSDSGPPRNAERRIAGSTGSGPLISTADVITVSSRSRTKLTWVSCDAGAHITINRSQAHFCTESPFVINNNRRFFVSRRKTQNLSYQGRAIGQRRVQEIHETGPVRFFELPVLASV